MINKTVIIVPCYNTSSTIEKVINDIKATGFNNIVIGDDCSIDNTVSIVKKVFSETPIITVHNMIKIEQ